MLAPPKSYLTPSGRYKCQQCGNSYRYFKHLKRHNLQHTGERPFECNICGGCFTRSDCMQRHRINCKGKYARTKISQDGKRKLARRKVNREPHHDLAIPTDTSALASVKTEVQDPVFKLNIYGTSGPLRRSARVRAKIQESLSYDESDRSPLEDQEIDFPENTNVNREIIVDQQDDQNSPSVDSSSLSSQSPSFHSNGQTGSIHAGSLSPTEALESYVLGSPFGETDRPANSSDSSTGTLKSEGFSMAPSSLNSVIGDALDLRDSQCNMERPLFPSYSTPPSNCSSFFMLSPSPDSTPSYFCDKEQLGFTTPPRPADGYFDHQDMFAPPFRSPEELNIENQVYNGYTPDGTSMNATIDPNMTSEQTEPASMFSVTHRFPPEIFYDCDLNSFGRMFSSCPVERH